ncbi:hypothetical protein [Francisella sp. LA112445]|uniref:hypothetical protein n=1 Tax=Francisella sp. LA112445 TaxID=1395624 RepID=UPI001788E639|nr:hypothetical protein [Francisella sp. LA112445]QIW10998.1 hypothetical protein FIP56_09950 [Francisella sp. LA112445]
MFYFLIDVIAICFSVIPFLFGRSINKSFLGFCSSILSLIFCILNFDFVFLAILLSVVSLIYMSRKNNLENYQELLRKARH